MGQRESMLPDDDLLGALRKAVDQVRQDPVSEDLVDRCAARAAEIPGLEAVRPAYANLIQVGMTEAPNAWHWPAAICLVTSILITLSLNALQIALDRPDPHRQQAALLATANQQNYCIYSDLRLERASSVSNSH